MNQNLYSTDRCKYPFIPHDERDSFNYPTSILCTKRGFVFVLEKWQILILNEDLECYQPPMKGQYSGLVEESDGSVSTLRVRSNIFLLTTIICFCIRSSTVKSSSIALNGWTPPKRQDMKIGF